MRKYWTWLFSAKKLVLSKVKQLEPFITSTPPLLNHNKITAQTTDLYCCPPLNPFLKQSYIHWPGHKFSIAKKSKLWSLLILRVFRCWVISGTACSTTVRTHEHHWLPHGRAMLSASLLLWWQFVLCWCKCVHGTCTWLLTYPAGSLPPCRSLKSKCVTFLPVNGSLS